MKIFKYKLEIQDEQILNLPINWKCLDIQVQNDAIYMWAMIAEDVACRDYKISCVGTGQETFLTDYLGTVQLGSFVWHFFKQ